MEIERKFILNEEYAKSLDSSELERHEIEQFYVEFGSTEERFRKKGDKYFHTIKKKVDGGLSREEFESECSKQDFEKNFDKHIGNVVHKTRYELPYLGHTIEMDIYHGELAGLAIAEVEFENEVTAKNFEAPDFFEEEVTDNPAFKNQNLAKNGLPETLRREL